MHSLCSWCRFRVRLSQSLLRLQRQQRPLPQITLQFPLRFQLVHEWGCVRQPGTQTKSLATDLASMKYKACKLATIPGAEETIQCFVTSDKLTRFRWLWQLLAVCILRLRFRQFRLRLRLFKHSHRFQVRPGPASLFFRSRMPMARGGFEPSK